MNRLLPIALFAASMLLIGCAKSEQVPAEAVVYESKADGEVRFAPLHIHLDSAGPVAAYQVEIVVIQGEAEIVGVEGSAIEGFTDAPYYDPEALTAERIIIAAFSTSHTLPRGDQRVATLHMRESGDAPVRYEIKTIATADSKGVPVHAKAFAQGK